MTFFDVLIAVVRTNYDSTVLNCYGRGGLDVEVSVLVFLNNGYSVATKIKSELLINSSNISCSLDSVVIKKLNCSTLRSDYDSLVKSEGVITIKRTAAMIY